MSLVVLARVWNWLLGGKAQGYLEGLCPVLPVSSRGTFPFTVLSSGKRAIGSVPRSNIST